MAADSHRPLTWATNSWAKVDDGVLSDSQCKLLEQTFKLSDFAVRKDSSDAETPTLECEYDSADFQKSSWWVAISRQLESYCPELSFTVKSVTGVSIAFGDTSEFRYNTDKNEIHCLVYINQSWNVNEGGCILFGDDEPIFCVAPRSGRLLTVGPSSGYLLTTPSRYATAMLLMLHIVIKKNL